MEPHLGAAEHVAAGLRILPQAASAWAATQGAWRFYHNPRVRMPEVAGPLLRQALAARAAACQEYALGMQEWARLGSKGQGRKQGRMP